MKKILILAIALLFVAGLAMADLTVTGSVDYRIDHYTNDAGVIGANTSSYGEVKVMGAGSNDFASINIDLKAGDYDATVGVDKAYITLDVLGALGVEGLPVTLKAILAYAEVKGSEVWKVTRLGIEGEMTDTGGKAGQFAFESVIMDMVTIKIAQQTNDTNKDSLYENHAIAPVLVSAKASIEFVDVAVNLGISERQTEDMVAVFSAGVAADLATILGMDLISALKIGVGVGSPNVAASGGADINWGAGVNLELAPMDMVTVRFGISTYNSIPNGGNAAAFQNLGLDLEVWYDFIGLGANTVLALGNSAGTDIDTMIGVTEVVILAKLSSVSMHLGFAINMDDGVDVAGDLNGKGKKYASNAPDAESMGVTFKASLKI